MATLRPRSWICQEICGATSSACRCKPDFFHRGGLQVKDESFSCWISGLRLELGKRRRSKLVAGGLGWEGHEMENSEEDKRFVEAIREAQPYISAYRGSTFVVVLHSEIVSNPNLDTILKKPSWQAISDFQCPSVILPCAIQDICGKIDFRPK